MAGEQSQQTERRIRIHTTGDTIDGVLHVAAVLRTLDDLNMQGRNFVTVDEPTPFPNRERPGGVDTTWAFGPDELAISRRSILFVLELSNPPRRKQQFAGTFSRGSMRLRVGRYDVEGFLHVPPGGDCLKRLNQASHPFISLTSVSVIGPDTQFAAPFLAVNREHILAAQEIFHDDDDDETRSEVPAETQDELEMSFEVTD